MGNETLTHACSTDAPSLAGTLSAINQTMAQLTRDVSALKRTQGTELRGHEIKRQKTTVETLISEDEGLSSSDNEVLIDNFFDDGQDTQHGDEWSDINSFFQTTDDVGEPVSEELAKVVNSALRSKLKDDRVKELNEKHR